MELETKGEQEEARPVVDMAEIQRRVRRQPLLTTRSRTPAELIR
jgi:hypothetical protein